MRQSLFAASALLSLMLAASQPGPVMAQTSAFSPRILVNGKAVTHYEFEQRLRFMRLLNAPGDALKEAENTLIDDRLRLAEAERLKIRISPAEIQAGMEEFSGRFEIPLEEFIKIIEANGVASETFRDFVHSGVAWRSVVRQRFGPGAIASVYEPEIDRALSSPLVQKGAMRVLLSEIILPTSQKVQAFELSQSLRGEAAFAAAARSHSVGETAADGGRTGWKNVITLPETLIATLQGLSPGGVSAPVRLSDGRYGIFLLRRMENLERLTPRHIAIDHARLAIGPAGAPATEAVLAKIRADVDTCTDLNGFAGELTRETVVQSSLPSDLAGRLAVLDENEMTSYVAGGNQIVLMLCSSQVESEGEVARETVRTRVAESRVSTQAELYLQQLRSNAYIRKP